MPLFGCFLLSYLGKIKQSVVVHGFAIAPYNPRANFLGEIIVILVRVTIPYSYLHRRACMAIYVLRWFHGQSTRAAL